MKLNFENYSTYSHPEDIKRLGFVVNAILDYVPSGSKILDMGCGKGNMAIQLAKMGYDVVGIDSDKLSVEHAESLIQLPNLKFSISTVEEFECNEKSVDVIICSEIIEHLVDPFSFLKKTITFLKDDGILIITIPNGRGPRELLVTRPFLYLTSHYKFLQKGFRYLKKLLGYQGSDQSKAENLEHLHFFTFTQLKRMAGKFGFEIIRKGKSDFIENTFPLSLFTNRIHILKEWDNKIADYLPNSMVSGFFTVWKKRITSS